MMLVNGDINLLEELAFQEVVWLMHAAGSNSYLPNSMFPRFETITKLLTVILSFVF